MIHFTLSNTGKKIRIAEQLGRGGEGAVYAVDGSGDYVAKIYSVPPDKEKTLKLVRMSQVGTPSILKIAAWPIDLLLDSEKQVRGFIMPRVLARRDIHELYSPKSRAERFPEADFRFILHVGANVSRAFAVIHGHGHIVGDVNHGNLLVGADATVMLIDCDSFQIANGDQVYTCDVGVPLFTPSELHGRSFRGVLRMLDFKLNGLIFSD